MTLRLVAALTAILSVLPAIAQQDNVRCNVPDKDGKMLSISTTRADCLAQIRQVQARAARSGLAEERPINISEAIKSYCVTSTSTGCSLFVGKGSKCPGLAANGYSFLEYARNAQIKMGATPKQARELAVGVFNRNGQIHPDDVRWLAVQSQKIADTEPPEKFRNIVLEQCIATAAE